MSRPEGLAIKQVYTERSLPVFCLVFRHDLKSCLQSSLVWNDTFVSQLLSWIIMVLLTLSVLDCSDWLFFFVPSQLLLTHISVSICSHWHTVTHWAALGFKTVQMAFYTGNIAKGGLAIYKERRLLQEVQEKLFRCVPPELLTISWYLFILIS